MPALPSSRGLSPRVRGNQRPDATASPVVRSIPRVCGGTRAAARPREPGRGSIPACAGEPTFACHWVFPYRVYPRVCGGTVDAPPAIRPRLGLSPRVRGNPPAEEPVRGSRRSIPACAGEPRRTLQRSSERWVYPRVCGGTDWVKDAIRTDVGLSPACAGEPGMFAFHEILQAVYPRVCGGTRHRATGREDRRGLSPRVRGTSPFHTTMSIRHGLSPRVRGNLRDRGDGGLCAGSIPACAGEPKL